MIPVALPEPAYTIVVTSTQRLEWDRIYRMAEMALDPEKLYHWLVKQPARQIVGKPSSAMRCLLATYLLAETGQLWCVSQELFWRFDLVRELAWRLPTWAASLERAELRMGAVFTATEGLGLVRRHLPRMPHALSESDPWRDEGRGA